MDWIDELRLDMTELETCRAEGQRLMRIVARYEPIVKAARRLMVKTQEPIEESPFNDGNHWFAFCGRHPDQGHAPRCPWQALVAALKGEG